MKKIITLFIIILMNFHQVISQENNNQISIGNRETIESSILDQKRDLLIYLPPSYNSNSDKKYPLIFLLDGRTYFKTTSAIVEFLSSDINRNYFMPEAIVVAIENIDRGHDFTFVKIKTVRKNTMGGGKNFQKFIQDELIPYIDNKYRTEKYRVLIGHSLGGLFALDVFRNSNLFDAFLSIDPSIWWEGDLIEKKVDSIPQNALNKKLYIATANQGEEKYHKNKQRHDEFFKYLLAKANSKENFKIEYFENEHHRSIPMKAIYNGLEFVFKKK